MSIIKKLIEEGLQRLTNRRKEMRKETTNTENTEFVTQLDPIDDRIRKPVAAIRGKCPCGHKIIEVNIITHRQVCEKCGQEIA